MIWNKNGMQRNLFCVINSKNINIRGKVFDVSADTVNCINIR